MTKEKLNQIKHSYKHSDCLVFTIGERVFVSFEGEYQKHRKEGTIEMKANEVDETCFYNHGEDYDGDTLSKILTIILKDPFADEPNIVATDYYEDEIVEMS